MFMDIVTECSHMGNAYAKMFMVYPTNECLSHIRSACTVENRFTRRGICSRYYTVTFVAHFVVAIGGEAVLKIVLPLLRISLPHSNATTQPVTTSVRTGIVSYSPAAPMARHVTIYFGVCGSRLRPAEYYRRRPVAVT